jgi:protein-S-isoprenylcysteine O-methyltransferase Ste14
MDGILVSMTPLTSAAIMLLSTAAYGALHSALASLPAKRLARRFAGPASDRYYRLGFNLVGTLTLLPLLVFVAWQPGRLLYAVPAPVSWFLLAGQAAALVVLVLGLLQTDAWHFLGLSQLTEPSGNPRLKTDGLYRHVRHPLYTAGFAFLWLTPLMTSTLFVFYLGLSVYLYLGSVFEEKRLLVEFGAAYREYQRKVPRLFPTLIRRRRASTASERLET